VNVLGHHQEEVCRLFTGRSPDRFTSIGWHAKRNGMPVLDDVIAWIGCDIDRVEEAGDHCGSSAESSNLKRSATVRRWSLCVAVLTCERVIRMAKRRVVLG